jgi:HK97 family phage prohead protease
MTMKLLSADDFRSEAKDGGKPEGTVFRFATGDPQAVDGATRTKRFVFSDATVDHAGDTIDPKGWDLSIFKRNPVSLFAHMSWEPPIGRASNVSVQNDQLVGDIEFAEAEVYEFADTIYRLVDGGFMKAVSVGFKPKEWAFTNDKNRPYGIDFKKQTLLEISICPVPCNPNALGEARSIGIDTSSLVEWAEKVLDNGDTVFLPRKEMEGLRAGAGAKDVRYYIHAPKALPAEAAERVRDAVANWQADPKSVLILEDGIELRTIGDGPNPAISEADEVTLVDEDGDEVSVVVAGILERSLTDEETTSIGSAIARSIAKAGRRLSAATKAKIAEAMGHHESVGKCLKDVMDADEATEDLNESDDGLTAQPPGTTVLESDDHLTPEERRIKEVRALRETLPTND